MRAENADVTYWQVQAQWIGKNQDKDWFFHTYCDIVTSKTYGKYKNDDDDPSACGNCWQRYGMNGVLNEAAGIKWLELVRRENRLQQEKSPDRIKISWDGKYIPVRFRLAKIHQTKKTEEINI
jgi:hypothetical protein